MVAVAITASNRAVAVQRWLPPPGPLAKAAARQRSSVATLTPTSRETRSTAELSGGNNRATIRSLYACPYLANFPKPKPPGSRSYPGGNFSDTGGKGGRARKLRDARVTAQGRQVGAVVCVHAKGMKEPWCLAASDPEATAAVLVNHYAKRWTIEPAFRDTKDLRFGMGLSSTRVGEPMRRDRLLLVSAFA